ncbi:MAG: pseudouridine synthase [Thermodesulfobacteriota bacterium]
MSGNQPLRLNKFLAQAGVCSRRKADELISSGRVAISGTTVYELGKKIIPGREAVEVKGIGTVKLKRDRHVYIMLNKPVRVVSTASDPQDRKTVLDFLPQEIRSRHVYPVGRLDYFSQGLILLTNDGDLTNRLTHPGFRHKKKYELIVRGRVSSEALNIMRSGMTLSEGEQLAPVEINKLPGRGMDTRLEMILIQGINRQIRRMCRDLDLTILKLKRVAHSGLNLGKLAPGKWRHLKNEEIDLLKKGNPSRSKGGKQTKNS